MLQFLCLSSNVSKLNIQGRLNRRISSNISDGELVITSFVSTGIQSTCKSLSELNFCMNHLILSNRHIIRKRLPKMLFTFSIMHGSRAGNMRSKKISKVYIFDFGDAPDWLMSAMNRDSFGWCVSFRLCIDSNFRCLYSVAMVDFFICSSSSIVYSRTILIAYHSASMCSPMQYTRQPLYCQGSSLAVNDQTWAFE